MRSHARVLKSAREERALNISNMGIQMRLGRAATSLKNATLTKLSMSVFALALVILAGAPAHSADATTPAAPALSGVELNGYLDMYWQWSPQAHAATAGPRVSEGRMFDRLNEQMTLNMVEISAKKKSGKVAYRIDADFGEMVDVLANNSATSAAMGVNNPNPAANEPTRNIAQATITYSASDRLAIAIGKFYTFLGFEVVKAKDNWNYSRSLAFNYAIPLWHEGANVTYTLIPTKLTGALYLMNSWDGRVSAENNKSPTYGVNLVYTGVSDLTLTYNYINDPEAGATNGQRDAHELSAVYVLNPKFSFAFDGFIGAQKKVSGANNAKWTGAALYAKASICNGYSLSPRYESYDDSDGGFSTGIRQKLTGLTLTNAFDLGDGLEARVEYRTDKSDSSTYFKSSDAVGTDHQDTWSVSALYSF